ncbi:MAG: hypothetical protein Q9P01_17330 [Anaerolineae bacterium]|nr:hypothetical protein [Anaerolineae bacterium]MDQ7036523.1 hypothetical protein [Anaerolineae bacterium]
MPYQMRLLNEGHVLLVQTGECVTMDEFAEINEKILMYSREAPGTFHLITDMLETREHPHSVRDFKHAVHWTREQNIGWVIYLSDNHFLNVLVDAAMNMHGQSYLVLNDLQAAMSIIGMDSGLPVD